MLQSVFTSQLLSKSSNIKACSANRLVLLACVVLNTRCLRYRPHWVRSSLQRRNRHYSTNRLSLLPKPPYIVTIVAMWSAYFTTTHDCCVSPFRLTGLLILMSSPELPMVKYNTLNYQTYSCHSLFRMRCVERQGMIADIQVVRNLLLRGA